MTDSTTTRIRLPSDVHRKVKAAAVLHDVRTDEALGMCVAWLVATVQPLSWLNKVNKRLDEEEEASKIPF